MINLPVVSSLTLKYAEFKPISEVALIEHKIKQKKMEIFKIFIGNYFWYWETKRKKAAFICFGKKSDPYSKCVNLCKCKHGTCKDIIQVPSLFHLW